MKNFWFVLIGVLLTLSCKKNDPWIVIGPDPVGNGGGNGGGGTTGLVVSRVQNAFGINFSGNWCPPCGASGIPALYQLSTTHGAKFHGMKIGLNGGGNDPFSIVEGSSMAGTYNVSGIPAYVAGANYLGSSSAWTSAVNAIVATTPANVKAGVALRRTKVGDSIYVDTKVEFFQAAPAGNYSLAVYLVENNITGVSQAGQSDPNFIHKMIFRGIANPIPTKPMVGNWGAELAAAGTAIPQGRTYETKYAYVAPQGLTPAVNLNNCQAIAVIFETDASGKPTQVLNSGRN